jgi:2,4-dichlorophenol 6-monooxygenase
VESNHRYASDAVIPDADAGDEPWPRDRQLHAQPTTRPGAKIPHAWLVGTDGRRLSTLDVVGRGLFTLVTGVSGTAWLAAASALGLPCLRTVVIGEPGALDPYYAWHRLREIDEAGALLVRPDGVIAWRCMGAPRDADTARRQLAQALASVLDRAL